MWAKNPFPLRAECDMLEKVIGPAFLILTDEEDKEDRDEDEYQHV